MGWKTIKEAKVGKALLRLLADGSQVKGLVILDNAIRAEETGEDRDRVWMALHDAAARLDPSFFGYAGARERFLKYFPLGFDDPQYGPHERDYKMKAKALIDGTVPVERARAGEPLGAAAMKAYQATNLLSPFEKAKLKDALNSPHSGEFLAAAAAFADGDLKGGLAGVQAVLKPFESNKWTVMTYLPYFWRPDRHMFLKPDATTKYATRVGHPFASVYKAELDPAVYESLIDLTETTRREIADLRPRDNIDVQSFIWTACEY